MRKPHRFALAKLITGIAVAACFAGQSVMAVVNTPDAFSPTATDLSVNSNYAATPSSSKDVEFIGPYTGGLTFTVNGAALNYGTLNDQDTSQSLVITDTSGTAGTITLNTAANSVSGTSTDLLYVESGANLTIQSGAGTTSLVLATAGTIDNSGTLTLNGPVSITAASGTMDFIGSSVTTMNGNLSIANAVRVEFDSGLTGAGQIQVGTTGTSLNDSSSTTTHSATVPITVSNAIGLNINNVTFTAGTFNSASVFYTPGSFLTAIGGTTSTLASITFSGVISGNSDVVISNSASTNSTSGGGGGGAVVLGLAGTNGSASGYETYTGNTIFNGNGTVTLAANNILPTSTNVIGPVSSGNTATFLLNGFNQTIASLSDGKTVSSSILLTIENGGTANSTLTIGSSLAGTQPNTGFSGAIINGSGGGALAIDKIGSNSLTLSPYASGINTFTGGVTVNAGALSASGSGALGSGSVTVVPTGSGAATLNATTPSLVNVTTLSVNNNGTTGALGTVNLTSNTSPAIGSLSGNGNVSLQGSSGTNLTIGTSTNLSANFSGVISETNVGKGLVTVGAAASGFTGTVTLSGPNTFTGGVTINSGTLQLGSSGALNSTVGSQNAVTFGSSTTGALALTGNSVTISSLNGSASGPVVENANGSSVSNAMLTVGNSTNASSTYAGVIQNGSGGGTLGLMTAGTGTVALSGANTYTGATTVTAGSLVVDGSISGSAATVQTGGTLGGSGTVGNLIVQSGGTVAPGLEASGETIKTLTASGFTWNGGATMSMELSPSSSASDELSLGSGALTEGTPGTYQFNFLGGGEAGQTYDLVNFTSTNFASASAFSATNLGSGLSANFELSGSELQVQIQAVPEPSALGAFAWGFGMLIGFRRFRRGVRI